MATGRFALVWWVAMLSCCYRQIYVEFVGYPRKGQNLGTDFIKGHEEG